LRRLSRNAPIFWHLLTTHFMSEKSRQVGWRKAFEVILRENAKETAALYKEGGSTALLAALIERFAKLCETHGSRPVLLIIPQPSDLSKKNGETPYREFFHTLESSIDVLDMTEAFSTHKEPNLLYVGGALGPHCSVEGNRLIADALNNLICAFPSRSKYSHCGTE
jgi:hypothetical protein